MKALGWPSEQVEATVSAQSAIRKAMILAAGEGARLKPLTDRVPKCMVPIWRKPVLEHSLEVLQRYGVRECVINLHRHPESVMNYFGDGSRWGVKITYSIESEPLGTAGGLRNVGEHFWGGPFLVWYGDNISTCDLNRLCAFHRAKGGVATIALFPREDVASSGIVGLDADDRIRRFLEKPGPGQVFSHWVNAGIYVLEPEVLEAIPRTGVPDFGRDIFPKLLAQDAGLFGYRMSKGEGLWWIDTPEDLRRVQALGRQE